MSTYDTLRHFADGIGLAIMFFIFLTLCAWPFRPGSKDKNRTAATMIFEGQDDGE
ncbi:MULTISPECIES: cbb3-type cytochrome oxidase subunit 3 [Qipengyuania]|uniref:Cbb3-type cytochrome c oxidase subunit 3 n=1 Tax=Qipengyuania soli TaxID=2782568 RepID=A0A7S8F5D8_9SPHN|nr:cbb3-type cytochrome c oxidase subunit 3 [Qipengyuania soli]QPC99461.1 cbb3-type cytochrome c oxidase subunit 3 [Qipengyuania soli]